MKKYLIGALLLTAMPAWAALPYATTPAEQAMCQVRVYSRLGERNENTMHMHHYCDGLRFLDRAYSAMSNKQDMKHYLNESIGNFDYVLAHTKEDYVMRGEVHVGKARALKLAGRKAEAVAEFSKALRYDINSTDAYQALADHYLETGSKTKALEMATEGLRRNPDSKGLKRRYTELGGKLPYPLPIETVPVEAQVAKPDETAASTPASPAEPATGTPATATPAVESIAAPKIGSPKNPYCRFCPD
ncbi:MAG: hypothetical protein U0938_05540 [Thiobacillus sp.]|nr:hypothetical protein [Thiobacillus sp.]